MRNSLYKYASGDLYPYGKLSLKVYYKSVLIVKRINVFTILLFFGNPYSNLDAPVTRFFSIKFLEAREEITISRKGEYQYTFVLNNSQQLQIEEVTEISTREAKQVRKWRRIKQPNGIP